MLLLLLLLLGLTVRYTLQAAFPPTTTAPHYLPWAGARALSLARCMCVCVCPSEPGDSPSRPNEPRLRHISENGGALHTHTATRTHIRRGRECACYRVKRERERERARERVRERERERETACCRQLGHAELTPAAADTERRCRGDKETATVQGSIGMVAT